MSCEPIVVMRRDGRKSVKQRDEIEWEEEGVRSRKREARMPYESVKRTERVARKEETRDVVKPLDVMVGGSGKEGRASGRRA